LKKTKNIKLRTYAYKVVLKKWYFDQLISRCISTKISRFILAKNPSEARKMIRKAAKKKTKPMGPYWDFVSITRITKKELIQRQRKWLRRVARLASYCPIGKRVVL